MNALTRKFPGMRTLLAPEAHLEQVLHMIMSSGYITKKKYSRDESDWGGGVFH